MQGLQEILRAARRLPEAERRLLIAELESTRADDVARQKGMTAMKRWLDLAGTVRSDHTDVAARKNEHLADIHSNKA